MVVVPSQPIEAGNTIIWTYSTSNRDDTILTCPCAGHKQSAFVESNYYCEIGSDVLLNSFYLSDPLWDGHGCPANSGCCAQLGMLWFYRRTPVPLSENITVWICKGEPYNNEDTVIEQLELCSPINLHLTY